MNCGVCEDQGCQTPCPVCGKSNGPHRVEKVADEIVICPSRPPRSNCSPECPSCAGANMVVQFAKVHGPGWVANCSRGLNRAERQMLKTRAKKQTRALA